jgi:Cu-Zn family superoxide dismutase
MKALIKLSVLVGVTALFASAGNLVAQENKPTKAICAVVPTEGNKCRGTVSFEAAGNGMVNVTASISGLNPNQKHAIHVHEFGDITNLTGMSAGGHYNPEKKPHGLPPAEERHAGDLGNLTADAEGKAMYKLTVKNISIADHNSILGRAIVIHAMPDDGGQPTGNAGGRIGFGVIGVAKSAD